MKKKEQQLNYKLIGTGLLLGISEILPFVNHEECNGITEKIVKVIKEELQSNR